MVEWVRDTKRSQTQCVSPRGPPPLAGHTLPVDQRDRGREGESGRVGEGHKEKPDSVCVSTGRVGVAEGHKEKPNSVCVNHRAQGDGGGEGEGGRVGEGHKEKPYSVCVSRGPRETRGAPRPPQKCIKIGQNEVRQPHGAQVFFRSEPKSTFLGLSRFRAVTPRETLFMHSSRIRGLLRMCPTKAHLRRTEFWGWT